MPRLILSDECQAPLVYGPRYTVDPNRGGGGVGRGWGGGGEGGERKG